MMQGMRFNEDMNRMNERDERYMGSNENRYERFRNEDRNEPRMWSSPWQSDRSRDERWGMGNMSEESDRFRAPSESYFGGRGGSMYGGQGRYQGFSGGGQGGQWREMGGQRDWRTPMYTQGVGSYDDRFFGGSYGAYGQGDYRNDERFGRGGERYSPGQSWGSSRGPFFGRGPKGYKRSDERIKEDVYERLSWGHLDASEVEVQVREGEVTLTGSVPSRDMKRIAEDLVEGISGVNDVTNQLRVKREGASASGERGAGMGDTSRKSSTSSTSQPQRS